ncbi:GNAT family N-acetyltransferase [Flavobacterium sp. AG291]|uniref:GNAT family N-acetyltransferase n=1 Tax=Flavobacterium sp. AG291 TaxID=2184000 RepID=UPI000E0B4509|nr:GNAT family N-acetyltransferase [Flavobacterium sp. AG291]RDI15894.1 ribosomal protein S18 acetylase RimI-like enzyme [Flavobacterium sp. AG291]
MIIRPYTPADGESIITLLRLNTPQYFAPEEEQDLRDYFANHIDRYFAVEDNSNIIGSGGINITNRGKNAALSWDIIHPEHQGKGVGRQLTQHRLDVIKSIAGIENISVRTSQLVYKFYEKFGFALKEVIKDYWAKGIDMYRMEMLYNDLV